jgi:hypothetical protein
MSVISGLLRMFCRSFDRLCLIENLSGHFRDVATWVPLQFARFAAWCSHGTAFLPQPSATHWCLAPSCSPAQMQHLAISVLLFYFSFSHTAFKPNSLWHVGYLHDDFYGFHISSRSRASFPLYNPARRPASTEPPRLSG